VSLSNPPQYSINLDGCKVLYLFIVETANTGIDMAMMYQPLILEYGTFLDILYSGYRPLKPLLPGHPLRVFPVSEYDIFFVKK